MNDRFRNAYWSASDTFLELPISVSCTEPLFVLYGLLMVVILVVGLID